MGVRNTPRLGRGPEVLGVTASSRKGAALDGGGTKRLGEPVSKVTLKVWGRGLS